MDLLGENPSFSMSNPKWPLHTFYPPLPPASFTDTNDYKSIVSHSMISAGCEIRGATIKRSVIGFRCLAENGAIVDGCVLIGDDKIGQGAKIRRVILDRHVEIAPGFSIGYDPIQDQLLINKTKNSYISPQGIIVIPQGVRLGFN